MVQHCDPAEIGFATTADVDTEHFMFGQDRALAALEFGARIDEEGFNLYVLGRPGSQRHTVATNFLQHEARQRPTPTEWCYFNNFDDAAKPRGLSLPAGIGKQLKRDVTRLIEELRTAIPAAFESENYRNQLAEIEQEFTDRHKQFMEALQEEAEQANLGLMPTPHGFAMAPIRDGHVMAEKDFEALPQEEREKIENDITRLSEKLRQHFENLPAWHKQRREQVRDLDQKIVNQAVGMLLSGLREKYDDYPDVIEYLDAIRGDVIERAQELRSLEEQGSLPMAMRVDVGQLFQRYELNVLISHKPDTGAPVVYESNPTYQNLVGRIEHVSRMGNLVTDFTMIRAGALHRANGGYLILDADKILRQPFAWDGLKRAIKNREVRIESIAQFLSMISAESLEPDPMPLQVKIVLIGDRLLYYLLCQLDPEFSQLFKVAADFEDRIARNAENTPLYSRMLASIVRQKELTHFSGAAIARIIEESSRIVGDSAKLSTDIERITDLMSEANFLARERQADTVDAGDVNRAVERQIHRQDRLRADRQEAIQRNIIHVRTDGDAVAQVNGLSVLQLGEFAFGQPSRITATVRVGDGRVIDIERETDLGGSIHSKGVMILSAFLGARYAHDWPLSFAASLVFEQSYGGVDGDSASVAELAALLSAISGTPVRQSLAVTGSVDQHGRVQAIGGVNQKIEGFFDICHGRGLTGSQGVLIPADNEPHLMLRKDVVDAIAARQFHVYPLRDIDDALSLLTGKPAGKRDAEGHFPVNTVNRAVETELRRLASHRKAFAAPRERSRRPERTPKSS